MQSLVQYEELQMFGILHILTILRKRNVKHISTWKINKNCTAKGNVLKRRKKLLSKRKSIN